MECSWIRRSPSKSSTGDRKLTSDTSGAPFPSRTDSSAIEPRYLAALEAERAGWWSSDNFDTWKNLSVSEYARGFYVLGTLAGLVLMPRRLQIRYFEKLRLGGEETFDVEVIPARWRIRRMLRSAGFTEQASPRELWVHHLRNRIARPDEVRPGPRRRMAAYLSTRTWPFRSRVMRWFRDVSIGSNLFIARRLP
jgi:hypothetical protein